MEECLFVSDVNKLECLSKKHSRLYFGVEFCERLIPTAKEVERAMVAARDSGVGFSFVTPYVSDRGLRMLGPLLSLIDREMPGSELVFNDWGVLRVAGKRSPSLRPVMGRVLVKQQKDPRIVNLAGRVPGEMIVHYKSSNVAVPAVSSFLHGLGVGRVELDNPLHGIDVDLKKAGLSGSLYVPYVYVTTTRYCIASGCDRLDMEEGAGTGDCSRECQTYTFRLRHDSMPVCISVRGNTQFVKNDDIPAKIEGMGIDRIVRQPDLPL